MKETLWIHVPKNKIELLKKWKKNIQYETYNENGIKFISYKFETNKEEFNLFIKDIECNNIEKSIFRREYDFTKKEKDTAEILELTLPDNAKDSLTNNDEGYICHKCKQRVLFQKTEKIHINYRKAKLNNMCTTYSGNLEIIISNKLRKILESEKIMNVGLLPIYDINTKKEIKDYCQLDLEVGIGEIVDPAIVEKNKKCDTCGFYEVFLCQTPRYFRKDDWKKMDISYSKDWFGSPPFYQQHDVIISQKFYQLLLKYKIKPISVQPAFLI